MRHIYTQTNETENMVIHFSQNDDGTLKEVARKATGGKGTGGFSPATGEDGVPDSLLSSSSVVASKDGTLLFTTNAGDNSVTCFAVGADGSLTMSDRAATGNVVTGRAGTANSLAYNNEAGILYVNHSFGPDHVRALKVEGGKFASTDVAKSVNLPELPERVPTQILLTPDAMFLLAFVLFDAKPTAAGLSPAMKKTVIAFPVADDGMLGEPVYSEPGGIAPFAGCFLSGRKDTFVTVLAAEGAATLCRIGADGAITASPKAKIAPMMVDGKPMEPSEVCWVSVTDDDMYAFGTNFGYGTVTSFLVKEDMLDIAHNEAAMEPGDGKYKGLAGIVSSSPGDSVVAGGFFYQLYANASKIVSYRIEADGRLTKVGESAVPYTSTQGLAKI